MDSHFFNSITKLFGMIKGIWIILCESLWSLARTVWPDFAKFCIFGEFLKEIYLYLAKFWAYFVHFLCYYVHFNEWPNLEFFWQIWNKPFLVTLLGSLWPVQRLQWVIFDKGRADKTFLLRAVTHSLEVNPYNFFSKKDKQSRV